mmetsp:Transcript_65851/g.157378  ORF Transcript_65851/g.157378 Transcript_65851/m.157378 type:complete len:528 (-) Transcript_65851:141-1724(-)
MSEVRQRRGTADTPRGSSNGNSNQSNGATASASKDHETNGALPGAGTSLLKARNPGDVLARVAFVGIFIVENIMHAIHFEMEVQNLVIPAWKPLPREVAVCVHIMHVVLGLFGALYIIISCFDSAGRTALTKGAGMLLVFMTTITWTWWINRQGLLFWDIEDYPVWDARCGPEKRNRFVHICKNVSIVGGTFIYKRLARYDAEVFPCRPSFLEGLVTSMRIWTLATTLVPVLIIMAVAQPRLGISLPSYTLIFALMLSLSACQVSANLVNSYVDFKKGIDVKETAGDRTLVDNLVTPGLLKVLAVFALLWWLTFFSWTAIASDFHRSVMYPAVIGTIIALGYTAGPAPLKYMGFGDISVFACFGPLMAIYVSHVLIASVPLEAIAFVMPTTLYTVAILHANNYRDLEADRQVGAVTVAGILGARLSLHYYTLLLAGAHLGILAIGAWFGCIGVVASLPVLPQTAWLLWRIRQPHLLRKQDEETAKTMFMFGITIALGVTSMPRMEFSLPGFGLSIFVVLVLKFLDDD